MTTALSNEPPTPRVFISYSWDSEAHSAWVLQLATRLRGDGIDVVLDRWDTELGRDLSLFMERAGDTTYRVLVICTDRYVQKANAAEGGVGYERKMITPSLMADLHGNRVVPALRDNESGTLPRFLGAAKYVDFRVDDLTNQPYFELLQGLHGLEPTPKPPLGRNPFRALPLDEVESALREDAARYVMPALEGQVTFDYSNNNGRYVIGAGERKFTVQFGESGYGSVYVLSDPDDIKTVALARGVSSPDQLDDAATYDASSRHRTIRVGDAAILRNVKNYWAAVFVDRVYVRETGPTGEPQVTFRYSIPPVPRSDFADREPVN